MRHFERWNNIVGWAVFLVALCVYIATAERTVSWWDCGEYIATSGKLMVGHPPGAPTFQILGCLAQVFTFGNTAASAFAVNILSALCSAFTILFLFWTLSLLARKLTSHAALTLASAAVGALAYTFSDTFWFSSAEGEVYAMSSFFTAVTFWAILKWERCADEPRHLRWIVFIAFMIGLAIGVHLLNLLVIPAMVFTVYYRKFPRSRKGFGLSLLLSAALVALVLWGVVPYTVRLAGMFEIFFVNKLHLPFHSGTIFYFVLLALALAGGIWYTQRKNRVAANTALLSIAFILIGYSTFFTLVIRANAGVPVNENEPKDALSLLAYLNREQYGSRPLLYGQYFNAEIQNYKEAQPRYCPNEEKGVYDAMEGGTGKYVYDRAHCGLFPRMYSGENTSSRPHIDYYRFWSGTDADKGTAKPTALENFRFMVRYQCGWMYWRYFMWNFAGRQNNMQGLGYNSDGSRDVFNGNWISGIRFLDAWRLGPQKALPDYLKDNQARNTFFFLPLLLGLCGLFFQLRRRREDCFIVFLLFFMTGLAIVLYLNQPSVEPRERDYAYAGSFYAFALWIGLGVTALGERLSRLMKPKIAVPLVFVCTLGVPLLMAEQGWDDHNRSHRTAAYDFGKNSLLSCAEDAVLVVNGDNDTFPLWYCQEMEGIRTDVRIVNSALANSYWHVEPLLRRIYNGAPLKHTLPASAYGQRSPNYALKYNEDPGGWLDLRDVMAFVGSPNPKTKQRARDGALYPVFPVSKVKMEMPDGTEVRFEVKPSSRAIYRADLVLLDIFSANGFDRPLHFMSPYAQSGILPLSQLCQGEGAVYRLGTEVNANRAVTAQNGINTDKGYELFVNRFRWGNLQDPKTAVDPESRNYAASIRYQYAQLARALTFEHKRDSALAVLGRCLEFFPDNKVPYDLSMVYIMEEYIKAGEARKALEIASRIEESCLQRLAYVAGFPPRFARSVRYETARCKDMLGRLHRSLSAYADTDPLLARKAEQIQNIEY